MFLADFRKLCVWKTDPRERLIIMWKLKGHQMWSSISNKVLDKKCPLFLTATRFPTWPQRGLILESRWTTKDRLQNRRRVAAVIHKRHKTQVSQRKPLTAVPVILERLYTSITALIIPSICIWIIMAWKRSERQFRPTSSSSFPPLWSFSRRKFDFHNYNRFHRSKWRTMRLSTYIPSPWSIN